MRSPPPPHTRTPATLPQQQQRQPSFTVVRKQIRKKSDLRQTHWNLGQSDTTSLENPVDTSTEQSSWGILLSSNEG